MGNEAKKDLGEKSNVDSSLVLEKLCASPVFKVRLKGQKETMIRFAEVLSDPSKLKRTYLTTDWVETLGFYNKYAKGNEGGGQKKRNTSFSSESTEDEADALTEEIIEEVNKDAEVLMKDLKSSIKVKIIIAEISHTAFKKNFRKLVSPVLSKLDLLPEFGLFHSALMIGPWLVEWNDSGLCIPRKCVSRAALLSADISAISTEKKIGEVVDGLAKVIAKWNATKKYSDTPKKKIEGNCQDFVNDVLQNIGIKPDFKGPLGAFLKQLRVKGKAKLQFHLNDKLRQTFKLKEKKIAFKTHKELDDFVHKLISIDSEVDQKFPSEWAFLKSFDRAFWMRHYKFPSDSKWTPHQKEIKFRGEIDYECDCPFGDPQETYSIRFLQ